MSPFTSNVLGIGVDETKWGKTVETAVADLKKRDASWQVTATALVTVTQAIEYLKKHDDVDVIVFENTRGFGALEFLNQARLLAEAVGDKEGAPLVLLSWEYEHVPLLEAAFMGRRVPVQTGWSLAIGIVERWDVEDQRMRALAAS